MLMAIVKPSSCRSSVPNRAESWDRVRTYSGQPAAQAHDSVTRPMIGPSNMSACGHDGENVSSTSTQPRAIARRCGVAANRRREAEAHYFLLEKVVRA